MMLHYNFPYNYHCIAVRYFLCTNDITAHTHLLRNIFANSDVECVVHDKTLQLNLTGEIWWSEAKTLAKLILLRPC